MKYEIEKGDKFLCLKDYIMDIGKVAYSKGKVYSSGAHNCITDNEHEIWHIMSNQEDFFEYFKLVTSEEKQVSYQSINLI